MKSFKDFVMEAKQVGLIHHFTKFDNLKYMIHQETPFRLFSMNGENISFTRNQILPVLNRHFSECNVKITVDGDLLSNRYKIKPIAGLPTHSGGTLDFSNKNRVPRNKGEAEEMVSSGQVDILPYIKKIHILSHPDIHNSYHSEIKPALDKLKIPHDYIKSYSMTNLHESYHDSVSLNYDFHCEVSGELNLSGVIKPSAVWVKREVI